MSDGTDEPVVSLDGVEVHFSQQTGLSSLLGEDKPVRAVDGVSLDIYENDVIALVGESGCGKTTLGKTAVALQQPTSGRVTYRGQDVWEAKKGARLGRFTSNDGTSWSQIRRSLQIIHQDPTSSLNPNAKVLAILSEPMRRWEPDLDFEARRARVLSLIERVGMSPPEDYAQRYPHQLSGGEKQRVVLIRALLMNPDLILADEAISALDVSLRIELMDLMHELQDIVNTSFLFISHDLANARYFTEKVGGRIGIMYLGELVEIGPAERIIENPRHPYTKALMWATPDLRPDGTDASDVPIRTIDVPDPVDPPSGCRFHTRCPEAREACKRESPASFSVDESGRHVAACFREVDGHDYWESEPIED